MKFKVSKIHENGEMEMWEVEADSPEDAKDIVLEEQNIEINEDL